MTNGFNANETENTSNARFYSFSDFPFTLMTI